MRLEVPSGFPRAVRGYFRDMAGLLGVFPGPSWNWKRLGFEGLSELARVFLEDSVV